MLAKNVDILVESQNSKEPRNKKKKHMEKQKLIKKKERIFSGPKRWLNTYQIHQRGIK